MKDSTVGVVLYIVGGLQVARGALDIVSGGLVAAGATPPAASGTVAGSGSPETVGAGVSAAVGRGIGGTLAIVGGVLGVALGAVVIYGGARLRAP